MRELLLGALLCAGASLPMTISAEEEPIKTETPVVVKYVGERDAQGNVHYQKHADADAGVAIPYRLQGSLPSEWETFDTYYYSFDDQLDDSLVLDPASVKVEQVTTGETVKKDLTQSAEILFENRSNSLHVTFSDLKCLIEADPTTDIIRVSYEASLHPERMKHGTTDSNNNVVSLEYTMKGVQPASFSRKLLSSTTTERSVEDMAKVYTWKLRVEKEDLNTRKALKAVEFSLKDSEGNYVRADGTRSATKATYKTNGKGILEFPGLDADTYELEEVKTAEGYVLLKDPIKLQIKSSVPDTSTLDDEVTLTATASDETNAKITLTDEQNGVLELTVLNRQKPTSGNNANTGLFQSGMQWIGLLLASTCGGAIISRKRK